MTRVKICGITSIEDARAAVEAGADALGFVFAPRTPREVNPEVARDIIRALPPFVVPVGVFVDQSPEEILRLVTRCGLQAIQLHGNEPEALSRQLSLPVIKAIRVRDLRDIAPIATYPAHAFLLDAFVEGMAGGTGTCVPWEVARQVRSTVPIILAGGLRPETVAEAVSIVRPYAVDVSSGVEERPGRKDHKKVREFIAAVREADRDEAERW